MADVLMVASSVWVLDGVHGATTDLGEAVPLHAVLVEVAAGLQDRLLHAPTSRHDADDPAAARGHGLACAGRHADTRLPPVLRMPHDDARSTRCAGHLAAVSKLLLDHGACCSLGDVLQSEAVADGELRAGTCVDELPGVDAFHSHKQVLLE